MRDLEDAYLHTQEGNMGGIFKEAVVEKYHFFQMSGVQLTE